MRTQTRDARTRTARIGWGLLLVMSALLTLAGIMWTVILPGTALDNIAEFAGTTPEALMPAYGIITLIARGYGAGFACTGLMALLVAAEGFRHGTRWAWATGWVVVLAYAAIAWTFLAAGERVELSLGVLSLGVVAAVGLLLAGRDAVDRRSRTT
ncbi:hypothetical protein GCM10009819_00720 [Agromyces tropicus]|uniref:DUF2127 domain-containing protein n=1 Tax=Agromyces tropicus TaxID=555371 RepID=A0ABP5FCX5_9MICO